MSGTDNKQNNPIQSALMAAPFVPEDAPFDAQQRQWLNGFLSGLTVIARGANGAGASHAKDEPGTPLHILYGSQSGNCEALSKQLRKHAKTKGFEGKIKELNSVGLDELNQLSHVLILTSTFGEGDPPDNAKSFYEAIMDEQAPALNESLHYAVCALGDKGYTHFNKCGIDIDNRLAELGATRISGRAECDVDFEETYEAWLGGVFESDVMKSVAASVSAGQSSAATDDRQETIGYDKKNPFQATLLETYNLNGPESGKRIHHISFSLAGSGLSYEAGDALGVYPVNCQSYVKMLLEVTGLKPDVLVELKKSQGGGAMPLFQALLRKFDLSTITVELLAALSEKSEDEDLKAFASPSEHGDRLDALAKFIDGRQVIDIFETFKIDMSLDGSAQLLIDHLRPLQPRLYSIASSPKAHPGQVQLTVGVVNYETHGRKRKGVASTFLAERMAIGSTTGVFVNHSPHFRPPENGDTPMIMVGPGTGIAPFRAFLEERKATEAKGHNWLFFGDQHEACDFIYKSQLLAMKDEGILTRLDTAWSRDHAEKVYVQHLMLQAAEELFDWLEKGAHFYVCGDASRMAKDVDDALTQVVAQGLKAENVSAETVQAYMKKLKDEHRYARDVY